MVMNSLPHALAGLAAFPQFIIYRADRDADTGKIAKRPVNIFSQAINAHDPKQWMTADAAFRTCATLGENFGVGFVLTANDPYFFLDIDSAYADGQWSDLATTLSTALQGCGVEVSTSGVGLHIIGRGAMPPEHRNKNVALQIELYTQERFIALTGTNATGNVDHTITPELAAWLIDNYFKPREYDSVVDDWTDGPVADWLGSVDDEDLVRRARASVSVRNAFKGGASFDDLWSGNVDVLAKAYPSSGMDEFDRSSADMALAAHLAFWTGKDCERIKRLMRRSALVREKWDARPEYLEDTIIEAVRLTREVCKDKTVAATASIAFDDFYAHGPSHQYLFTPTRELWPAASVNGRLGTVHVGDKSVSATAWLDKHRSIEQLTWHPAMPQLIEGRVMQISGWISHPGARVFNLYRNPIRRAASADAAKPWLDHVRYVYPSDSDHIIRWLAHRIQKPGEKINHALVLGGAPGVGKDTLIEPLVTGVGAWNWSDISPADMLRPFNGWTKAVVVRINEIRDLGEIDRFSFYDHSKTLITAPPDVIRVNEKHLRETYIPNVCGVIMTTNHRFDGLYLPADDRRHYVAWSEASQTAFTADYFPSMYRWFDNGGIDSVIAYLEQVDLSQFDAKAPPPKTPAFWQIVGANESPEAGELRDVLEALGNPPVVTLEAVAAKAFDMKCLDLRSELQDRKQRRSVPHKMGRVGYVPVRNPDAEDGRFKIGGTKQTIYALKTLPFAEQVRAARGMK